MTVHLSTDKLYITLSEKLAIPIEKAIGRRFAVIGQSGSGKSTTLYTFLSEWAAAGLPFTVNDPWTDFITLPNVLVVGMADGAHVRLTIDNAAALAEMSVKERISVVIDTRFYDNAEMLDIYSTYLSALWNALRAQQPYQPYALVMDEAQDFIPQNGDTPVKSLAIKLAKQGRHVRMTSLIASQRPASVTKDVLTQTEVLIGHSLKYPVETAIVREQLPLPAKDVNAMFRKLHPGEAIIVGSRDVVGDEDFLQTQIARHASMPNKTSGAVIVIPPATIDDALISRLRSTLATVDRVELPVRPTAQTVTAILPPVNQDDIAALKRQVAELNEKLIGVYRMLNRSLPVANAKGSATTAGGTQLELMDAAAEQREEVVVERTTERTTERFTSSRSLSIRTRNQREGFERFTADLRRLSKFQRAMLLMLSENPQRTYHVDELAPHFDRAPKTCYNTALILLNMKLVRQVQAKTYAANVAEYLQSQYPDLTIAELFEQLINVLAA